jgi:hypothetical protein
MANLMTVTSQRAAGGMTTSKEYITTTYARDLAVNHLTGDLVCWAQETQFNIVKFRANACDLCCCCVVPNAGPFFVQ